MDICDYILHDHDEQRRLFAILDEVPRDDTDALGVVWGRLANLLEVHAQAEEELFYPRLLKEGKGEGGTDGPVDETLDAVGDHDDIRKGVRAASAHDVGSKEWWDAVLAAREANDDHMGEEEREALPDFRHNSTPQERHDIGVRFAIYEARHADGHGIDSSDRGAQAYVDAHT
ncbi:hemerythrin domain-containing protein [Pseudokineococcus basanitobsidens]|uniref:Hemerythrin domain-containing protein n=1 Tax=Pseudokineococcus basanitobsidens TaxID=1926649 RepID=A0ABU8RNR6_9ACTN